MTNTETINYPVLNWQNEQTSQATITIDIASETAKYVVHRALVAQRFQKRRVIASTKIRSEVRGGGRKPWKQKGTGRARAGSNRSPLWRGGGVIFGPRNTINYVKKINQKENQLAIKTILFNKKNVTKVVENFEDKFEQSPSTKNIIKALEQWDVSKNQKVLIICNNKTINLYLSIRNLKNVDLINCRSLNTIDLLNAKSIIITSDSLPIIEELYNEK
uniref:Large ribosomal subunit protein uL4c n=1 Tax=Erythrotrichia carnea TaxID=35151 RepID=A0A1C9CEM8_9RHOD|nr:ribosomal protein L4 [Erythrotrichia carnea]AOM66858.1 ribosomal protein L4 [Erythrotrichia carnea]